MIVVHYAMKQMGYIMAFQRECFEVLSFTKSSTSVVAKALDSV